MMYCFSYMYCRLQYDGPGSVEDVFCVAWCVEEGRGGVRSEVELVPGGSHLPVTGEGRY